MYRIVPPMALGRNHLTGYFIGLAGIMPILPCPGGFHFPKVVQPLPQGNKGHDSYECIGSAFANRPLVIERSSIRSR